MKSPLTIPVDALERGPFHLEGTLPGSVLELENEVSIRNVGDVIYELTAERKNQEILITGRVEASMELECVRSGLFFSTIVGDSAFLRDYSTQDIQGDLDLTEDVREAVVIQIPNFPVSPEARSEAFELPKLPPDLTGEGDEEDDNPWNDLNRLNL